MKIKRLPRINPEEEIGKKYGKRTILQFINRTDKGIAIFEVICDCGKKDKIEICRLRKGRLLQCCKCKKDNHKGKPIRHGMTETPTYSTWLNMKQRCYNPKIESYHCYGGRGIKICDRWINSFDNFLIDMGEKPKGLTIDRIDVNGNYEPNNCHWITHKENMNNLRGSKKNKIKNQMEIL